MASGVFIPCFRACSECEEPIYPGQEYIWVHDDFYHKDCYEWLCEMELWEDDYNSWNEAENFPVAQ